MKNLLGRETALVVIGLVLLLATSSLAQQNLLTNPGFETGDFTGWMITQRSPNYGVNTNGFLITGTDPSFGPITVVVHSGNYAAYSTICDIWCYGQPDGMYVELSQTLSLTPGQVYTASYWIGNGWSHSIQPWPHIEVNGHRLLLTTNPFNVPPGQSTLATGDFIASQASTTISYFIDGGGDGIFGSSVDDLALVLNGLTPGDSNYAYLLQQSSNKITSYQVNSGGLLIPSTSPASNTGTSPVALAATGNLVYVADKGSSQVSAYLTNLSSNRMTPVPGSPYAAGIAPGAVALDRPLRFLYATGLDSDGHGAIVGWRYIPAFGGLTRIAGSPFPAGINPAGIAFDRSGLHAYVADTASNQLLAYAVNPTTGALTELSGSPYRTGVAPGAVVVDTLGNFLYVSTPGDQHITGFKIANSGELTPISGSPFPTGATPVAMTFDATQQYLYVACQAASNIWGYKVNPTTGALFVVTNSPFRAGALMHSITSVGGYVYTDSTTGIDAFQIAPGSGTLTAILDSPLGFFGTTIGSNSGSGSPH
jgi:6-phosphogluconolactonase (cycloisomerase 2 family)